MNNALDEVYDLAFDLADSDMPRGEVIRKALNMDEHTPEVWMVEWSARLSPELWQQVLASAVNAELNVRFGLVRHRVKDDDYISEEEKKATKDAAFAEKVTAWHSVKYQDIDHVARALCDLSRDWYGTGPKDVATGFRQIQIGEYKNGMHQELVDAEAWVPTELDPEIQEKYEALAEEIWPRGRKVS